MPTIFQKHMYCMKVIKHTVFKKSLPDLTFLGSHFFKFRSAILLNSSPSALWIGPQ